MAAIAIMFGWAFAGPAKIVRATDPAARRLIYAESLQMRGLLALVLIPAACAVAMWLASPEWRLEAGFYCASMAAAGLSPAFYCIGLGRPSLLAFYETVPKVGATALAALAIWLTSELMVYPLLVLATTAISLIVFSLREAPVPRAQWPRLRGLFQGIMSQRSVAASNILGSSYTQTPLPIATAVAAEGSVAALASVDRLYRLALFAVVALANTFQSWTLERSADPRRRQHSAIFAHLFLGVVGGLCLALIGPPATALLFGEAVAAGTVPSVGYGLAFLFVSITTPLVRNVLVPNGQARTVLRATLTSALVGIATMAILASQFGASAVPLGLAASEAVVLMVVAIPAVRALRTVRGPDGAD